VLARTLVLTLPTVLLAAAAVAQTVDTTTSGNSTAFNPAISLNALFLGHYLDGPDPGHADDGHDHAHDHGAPPPEGFSAQEIELRFTSDIDAYARADATLAFHGEHIHFEEAYADLLTLPAGLGLRAGQMFAPISRENILHTHNLPFVQRSLGQVTLFGEGWSSPGAQLSWLSSLPFYAEFRAAALDASHTEWFGSDKDGGIAGVGQILTMFDLSESTTLGLIGGGAIANNSLDDQSTVGSAGIDLRWKPARRTIYRGLRLNAEYLWAERNGAEPEADVDVRHPEQLQGLTTLCQFQFARRWWVSGRYDWLDPDEHETQTRWGASISFVASEFQALRLEYSSSDDGEELSNSVFLQYNITIGSHPAHLY